MVNVNENTNSSVVGELWVLVYFKISEDKCLSLLVREINLSPS